jgi:hypothetical protein
MFKDQYFQKVKSLQFNPFQKSIKHLPNKKAKTQANASIPSKLSDFLFIFSKKDIIQNKSESSEEHQMKHHLKRYQIFNRFQKAKCH